MVVESSFASKIFPVMCSISLGFQVAGHGADGFDKQVILPSESHLERVSIKTPVSFLEGSFFLGCGFSLFSLFPGT